MLEISELSEIFDTDGNHRWKELKENSAENNVENLVLEAENCQITDSKRASMVMLWSASIEKLKWMMLEFSQQKLRKAKGLEKREYHTTEDLDNIHDSDLIDAAEDIELLDSDEALHLQSIRSYIRNSCAHGDSIEIEEETIILVETMLNEYIFEKSDSAGITVDRILKILDQGDFPERMLDQVEHFSEQKKGKLVNKLFDKRINLPLKRMRVRENYQKSTDEYSRSELNERDLISDSIDTVWPKIPEDYRNLVKNRGKNRSKEKEGAKGFIIEVGNTEMTSKELTEFLVNNLLPNYSYRNKEDVNDVVFALYLIRKERLEVSENLAEKIWKFGFSECYATSKTRRLHKEFIEELNDEMKNLIIDDIEKNIKSYQERWSPEMIEMVSNEQVYQKTGIGYLLLYFDNHSETQRDRIENLLRNSDFSTLGRVKNILS